MPIQKHNATGRSVGANLASTKAKVWKANEPFLMLPRSVVQAINRFRLSGPAMRILVFLMEEHLDHGGAENGQLVAPHSVLRELGISGRDIGPALRELETFGLVRRTKEGSRLGGRAGSAEYALSWLPTADGEPATKAYLKVTIEMVDDLHAEQAQVRRFKRERAAAKKQKRLKSGTSEI